MSNKIESSILLVNEIQLAPKAKFFVMGGLTIEVSKLPELQHEIDEIKQDAEFNDKDDFTEQPSDTDLDTFNKAKTRVLEASSRLGVRLSAVAVHNAIATDDDRKLEHQFNLLLTEYNEQLKRREQSGSLLAKTSSYIGDHQVFGKYFKDPLIRPKGGEVYLDRIMFYATTKPENSYMFAPLDIALEALSVIINPDPESPSFPSGLMSLVARLFSSGDNQDRFTMERFLTSPVSVDVAAYEADYLSMLKRLENSCKEVDLESKYPAN